MTIISGKVMSCGKSCHICGHTSAFFYNAFSVSHHMTKRESADLVYFLKNLLTNTKNASCDSDTKGKLLLLDRLSKPRAFTAS